MELTAPQGVSEVGQSVWLEEVGLGLTLWSGQFEEEVTRLWLRWCDRNGQVIPTGAEGREIERQLTYTGSGMFPGNLAFNSVV